MVNIALKWGSAALAVIVLLGVASCGKKDREEAEKLREQVAGLLAARESLSAQQSKSQHELAALQEQNQVLAEERDALKAKVASTADSEKLKGDLAAQKARIRELEDQLGKLQQTHASAGPGERDPQSQAGQARRRLGELGGLLFERGDTDTALTVLQSARDLGASGPELFYRIAYCQAAAGQYDAAAASYQEALGALEGSPETNADLLKRCLTNYGVALTRLGKPEQAAESYRKAIALDEKYAPAYFNLGLLYAGELKRPVEAIEALRKHIIYGGERAASARDLIVNLQAAGAEGIGTSAPQTAPAVP